MGREFKTMQLSFQINSEELSDFNRDLTHICQKEQLTPKIVLEIYRHRYGKYYSVPVDYTNYYGSFVSSSGIVKFTEVEPKLITSTVWTNVD